MICGPASTCRPTAPGPLHTHQRLFVARPPSLNHPASRPVSSVVRMAVTPPDAATSDAPDQVSASLTLSQLPAGPTGGESDGTRRRQPRRPDQPETGAPWRLEGPIPPFGSESCADGLSRLDRHPAEPGLPSSGGESIARSVHVFYPH